MRLVSPLLKRAVYPTLHHTGWLGRITPQRGYAVVNYHGVVPSGYKSEEPVLDGNLVTAEVLRQQLRSLKSHYRVITPEEFRERVQHDEPIPLRSVLVTCDDGLANTLTDMLPVLQEEAVPCLFFVTAASASAQPGMLWYEEVHHLMRQRRLSAEILQALPIAESETHPSPNFQAQWWSIVKRASQMDAESRAQWSGRIRQQTGQVFLPDESRWRLLDAGELRKLRDAGMTIGAHSRTHPVLSLSSEQESRREILDCKIELERVLGQTVWAFAYPFGNPATVGERELRLAREAGYTCAFLNVEHWPGEESNPMAVPRIHVTADMTLPEFAAHLSGVHMRLRHAVGA
jgi:peptidoglycan/xylan/chitin deacetylase (PgdA/CDA1 family)